MRWSLAMALLAATATGALAQEPPPEAPPPESQPQPEVKPPAVKTPSEPVYPEKALADRVHAVVVLDITISDQGVVTNAAITSLTVIPEGGEPSSGDGSYGFGAAAIEAARKLVFTPAEFGGKPFEVQISFTYRFRLPPKQAEPTKPEKPARKPVVNLRGVLLERGTRTRVAGATITVYRGEGESLEGYEATSDAFGTFEFYDLAPGEWTIRVERAGYLTAETTETINANELLEANLYIEAGEASPYDVMVEAERPRKEVNRRSLDATELASVAGTISDDPVLVIENLPGVARTTGGEIVVRGSGPEDTGIFIDGIGVPLIYHFGGLKSVVPSTVVGGIDFFPGNYSVAYGRAMGGVFDLKLKRLDPDRVHGSADVSILDTSLYAEMPLGDDAAIAVAGRRSYVDFILDATIPDDIGLALTTAPRYYDYQILGNWRPRPAHDIRWLFLGSDDKFEVLFDDPADAVGPSVATDNGISASTAFQRGILDYRFTPSAAISNHLRLSLGTDRIDFNLFGAARADGRIITTQVREMVSWQATRALKLDAGLDAAVVQFDGSFRFPRFGREGSGGEEVDFGPDDFLETELDDLALNAAPFVEAQVTLGPVAVVPGLRLDYFGTSGKISIDPRVSARVDLGHQVAIKGGAAVVHQEPGFLDLDEVFGNPDLGLQRAYQYSIGAEWKPLEHIGGDLTMFYKDMDNLVSPTEALVERDGQMVPQVLDNGGSGRVYGAEVFLQHELANNFNGWLSYTVSRAERTDSGESGSRLFDFDQTHILAVVASYRLGSWLFGARWRLVSGSPTTPIIGGVFDSSSDSYMPIQGQVNSERLPMFRQLDVRVDKTWTFDTWSLACYLSLINAVNHGNVEQITYNYDYTERGSVNGLPILPVFGVKGTW